jgi:gamma-butyrobetaine dioxygenase
MIHSERYLYTLRLPESSITVFDNRRMLHGRRGFNDGAQHLIGCFANADDLRSRFRVLARRRIGATA